MVEYTIKPLSRDTWDDFAKLAERHNGCWCAVHGSCWAEGSGCWCKRLQRSCAEKQAGEGNRAPKERLVNEGRAHAALVFDDDVAVAWCEYGTPEELPNIYRRNEYEAAVDKSPDYRLTCLFADKSYRRRGVAGVALRGALQLIAQAGGGVVEAYPHDTDGQKISASFLYNGTRSLCEHAGFSYDRRKGEYHCVMSKTVPRRLARTIAPMPRTAGRALGGRTGLRTIRSAHHDVEGRPWWAQSQSAEECASCSLPIRELVARIPAPGGDHGKN